QAAMLPFVPPRRIKMLKEGEYDLGVVVAYGQLLSQEFLDTFQYGCVNVHSSLLPRWRGAAPMQRAIMAGDKKSGVSLQKIVKKLDAGDVIAERPLDIPLEMGTRELYTQLSFSGASLLTTELVEFLKGDRAATPQDESLVTVAKKIQKAEAAIDWTQSGIDVHNKIRGLDMGGPYAQTRFRGKGLKIHQSLWRERDHSAQPGMIVDVGRDSFHVACGSDEIEVFQVQPESKAKMQAADFIRGYHIKEGDCFES
ncbi:MAG: methionyl-tRNA formyltransferase, partial [Pseudomonadota bacterium]